MESVTFFFFNQTALLSITLYSSCLLSLSHSKTAHRYLTEWKSRLGQLVFLGAVATGELQSL